MSKADLDIESIAASLKSDGEQKTIMFVDMKNSTQITESQPENSWLSVYGVSLDAIIDSIPASGEIVKFTGDGFMIAFDMRNYATDAINCAIKIQEKIEDLNEHAQNAQFSIGIASGRVRRIKIHNYFDYLGETVNKAARLCSVAAANAIIVDSFTERAANEMFIESKLGKKLFPDGFGWFGDKITTELRGFKEKTICYEVQWDTKRYNISPQHHSSLITDRVEVKSQNSNTSIANNKNFDATSSKNIIEKQKRITKIKQDLNKGEVIKGSLFGQVIDAPTNVRIEGEDKNRYWCSPDNKCWFRQKPIEPGNDVFFVKILSDDTYNKAIKIIPLGERFIGSVEILNQNIAFIKGGIFDDIGHDLPYFDCDEFDGNFVKGTKVEFILGSKVSARGVKRPAALRVKIKNK